MVNANRSDDTTSGSSSCRPRSPFGERTRSTATRTRKTGDAQELLRWGNGELPTSHLRSYRSVRQRADNNTCIQRLREDVSLLGLVVLGSESSASAAGITVTVWGLGSAQITLPHPITRSRNLGIIPCTGSVAPHMRLLEGDWCRKGTRVFSFKPTAYHALSADDRFAHHLHHIMVTTKQLQTRYKYG